MKINLYLKYFAVLTIIVFLVSCDKSKDAESGEKMDNIGSEFESKLIGELKTINSAGYKFSYPGNWELVENKALDLRRTIYNIYLPDDFKNEEGKKGTNILILRQPVKTNNLDEYEKRTIEDASSMPTLGEIASARMKINGAEAFRIHFSYKAGLVKCDAVHTAILLKDGSLINVSMAAFDFDKVSFKEVKRAYEFIAGSIEIME